MMKALQAHTESHAPPQTRLTFRKLPFHAQPYLMPRDTVANRAATKVCLPAMLSIVLYMTLTAYAYVRAPMGRFEAAALLVKRKDVTTA